MKLRRRAMGVFVVVALICAVGAIQWWRAHRPLVVTIEDARISELDGALVFRCRVKHNAPFNSLFLRDEDGALCLERHTVDGWKTESASSPYIGASIEPGESLEIYATARERADKMQTSPYRLRVTFARLPSKLEQIGDILANREPDGVDVQVWIEPVTP